MVLQQHKEEVVAEEGSSASGTTRDPYLLCRAARPLSSPGNLNFLLNPCIGLTGAASFASSPCIISRTAATACTEMDTSAKATRQRDQLEGGADGADGQMKFPTEGILPKEETGAAAFIAENAEWDGRGIKIAIFDTGVDPGAAGLQVTSDGKRKVIDVVDCTGDGDVDMSEVKELKDATSITGLTGRVLKLGAWAEGLKEVRLGIKRGFELFPTGLTSRVKAERKEKFMESQKAAVAKAQQSIAQWDAANASPSEDKKREKKDLEAVLDTLKEGAEQYADAGPVFDCVVFNDGKWRAVIDTDGTGDLTNSAPLTNYRDEQQFMTIKTVAGCKEVSLLLNYCVTIFEDGKRLSIVCDSGAHVGSTVPDHVLASLLADEALTFGAALSGNACCWHCCCQLSRQPCAQRRGASSHSDFVSRVPTRALSSADVPDWAPLDLVWRGTSRLLARRSSRARSATRGWVRWRPAWAWCER
eukprot:139301-Rhodomonas_salina.3